ncbi:50S ribosomal protein L13 [Patescibacteria group bacterium]|nr:50S ribosomal protein L13 [Patescibacteria group bacterium]
MKTYQPKEKEITREWHLLDAKGQIVGRLATKISGLLMGKHKPNFSKHMDMGDYVVLLNAEKVEFSGKKEDKKLYRSHSGYPGGFKEITAKLLREKHPERIIRKAVFGMLPDNRQKKERLNRFKIIVGDTNPFKDKFLEK